MDQKKIERILGRNKGWESMARDSDKDGVINGLDCKPYDPNQQGIFHNISERYKEGKQARAHGRVASAQIRKKSRAEYYREKETQSMRVARERAKSEADKKIKYHKEGGFFGQVGRAADKLSAPKRTTKTYITRKAKPKKRRRTTRRKTETSSSGFDIFGGGSFV